MIKKTKIVATIGPATSSQDMLEKLLKEGVNVIRLNFSHGDFKEHQEKVDNFKKAMDKTGIIGGVLQDLSGPKIRLGDFYQEKVELKKGDLITITTEKIVGDEKKVSINYSLFPKEVKVGDNIMVDDGKKRFQVVSIKGDDVVCKIIVGGTTKGRRGVNLPDSEISIKSLTEKDIKDIEFGIKNKVDFFAFSFVRKPEDVVELREILKKKKSKAKIIAKIETPQAIRNFDEILSLCDGVMVARGDLAIEVPAEKVPQIQKMIIKKCNNAGKIVITATQMLESMIKSPVPTRAEISDVANAILDGTDAIMLSEETTLGEYPVEAVSMMSKIAYEIEHNYPERTIAYKNKREQNVEITDSVTESVVKVSQDVNAKLIVALTDSGFTAKMVARHRSEITILALTPSEITARQLSLSFGCVPMVVPVFDTLVETLKFLREFCIKNKYVKKGDNIVVTGGFPFKKKIISTNMLTVETI